MSEEKTAEPALCRHCRQAIRPHGMSVTGWAHSRHGIIVCTGREYYWTSFEARELAEPMPAPSPAVDRG